MDVRHDQLVRLLLVQGQIVVAAPLCVYTTVGPEEAVGGRGPSK